MILLQDNQYEWLNHVYHILKETPTLDTEL